MSIASDTPPSNTPPQPEPGGEDPKSRRARHRRLGDELRRMYEDVAREPVPDDFLKLLEDADRKNDDSSGHGS